MIHSSSILRRHEAAVKTAKGLVTLFSHVAKYFTAAAPWKGLNAFVDELRKLGYNLPETDYDVYAWRVTSNNMVDAPFELIQEACSKTMSDRLKTPDIFADKLDPDMAPRQMQVFLMQNFKLEALSQVKRYNQEISRKEMGAANPDEEGTDDPVELLAGGAVQQNTDDDQRTAEDVGSAVYDYIDAHCNRKQKGNILRMWLTVLENLKSGDSSVSSTMSDLYTKAGFYGSDKMQRAEPELKLKDYKLGRRAFNGMLNELNSFAADKSGDFPEYYKGVIKKMTELFHQRQIKELREDLAKLQAKKNTSTGLTEKDIQEIKELGAEIEELKMKNSFTVKS